ncbi:hypothetical protein [Paenibacillus taiwanensis]|uniref:hypothetical protein n=1 Tax=Paenibacillus taiwanensis TaxID=401638 RepID=UPI0003F8E364|nr:hypothetical protein [Paenibacillus taiwanensis]
MMVRWCEDDRLSWPVIRLCKCLKPLVDDWDPLSLLAKGAPEDEYDCLTAFLARRFFNECDAVQFADELEIFIEEHFGVGPAMMKSERAKRWRMQIESFCSVLIALRLPLLEYLQSFTEAHPPVEQLPQLRTACTSSSPQDS